MGQEAKKNWAGEREGDGLGGDCRSNRMTQQRNQMRQREKEGMGSL